MKRVCAWCGRIMKDASASGSPTTHGACADCLAAHFPRSAVRTYNPLPENEPFASEDSSGNNCAVRPVHDDGGHARTNDRPMT